VRRPSSAVRLSSRDRPAVCRIAGRCGLEAAAQQVLHAPCRGAGFGPQEFDQVQGVAARGAKQSVRVDLVASEMRGEAGAVGLLERPDGQTQRVLLSGDAGQERVQVGGRRFGVAGDADDAQAKFGRVDQQVFDQIQAGLI
jgi:hypothetical protein